MIYVQWLNLLLVCIAYDNSEILYGVKGPITLLKNKISSSAFVTSSYKLRRGNEYQRVKADEVGRKNFLQPVYMKPLSEERPSVSPTITMVIDEEEYALCSLLNISPSQKSLLPLTCNASAPSGSRMSENPCNLLDYFSCNIYGKITRISNIPIHGSLPSSIGNFSALTNLYLSGMQITGAIPTAIGNLKNLEVLDISSNALTGHIPLSIGNSIHLQTLYLYLNALTGPIPSSIGSLIHLQNLFLSSNELNGSIPSSIGNLILLQNLYLNSNALTGPIPSSIGSLMDLKNLYLNSNALNGSIPSSIGNLILLQNLYLYSNAFTGPIPSSIGSLIHLQVLMLQSNKLTGRIPWTIGNLIHLQDLRLHTNALTGPIASAIGNLTNLLFLELHTNALTGPIPSSIGNFIHLKNLYLYSNALTGRIPSTIGNLIHLQDLMLQSNKLTGRIPWTIGNLTNLLFLELRTNALTGPIPSTIGNLINLQNLFLHSNALTGPIPSSIGHLTNLEGFLLNSNKIAGSIPTTIGNLINLVALELHTNALTGPIPSSISNLINLVYLDLSSNKLTGRIPSTIGNLNKLQIIDISTNKLNGPVLLTALTSLHSLICSNNQFTGSIPRSIGNLVNISLIDFGYNQLHGIIPSEICRLQLLSSLLLAGNSFECYPPCISAIGDYSEAYEHCHNLQDIALCYFASIFKMPSKMKESLSVSQLVLQYFSSGSFPYKQTASVQNAVSYSFAFDARSWDFFQLFNFELRNSQGKIIFKGDSCGSPHCLPGVGTTLPLVIADSSFNLYTNPLYADYVPSSLEYRITVTVQSIGIGWNCITRNVSSGNSNRYVLQPYAPNFCLWTGISCAKNTSVTSLSLRGYRLQGPFPSSIGLFKNLVQLDLSFNQLSGTLPASLGNLLALNSLDVSSNLLNGTIHSGIQSLPELTFFSCRNNYFSGSLPIFTAKSLIHVYLDANNFQGTIFAELCHPMVVYSSGLVSITGNAQLTCYETCWLPFISRKIFDPRVQYCAPSSQPSNFPTMPTSQPSSMPSSAPSKPSCQPSNQPSSIPSLQPAHVPTTQPVPSPTRCPSKNPSRQPSKRPTRQPSAQPSNLPSSPSSKPSHFPSLQPTLQPTTAPSTLTTVIPLPFTSTSSLVITPLNGSLYGGAILLFLVVVVYFGSRMLVLHNRRSYYQGLPVHLAIVLGRKAPFVDAENVDLAYLLDKDGKTSLDLLLENRFRSLGDDLPSLEYVYQLVSGDLPILSEEQQHLQQQQQQQSTMSTKSNNFTSTILAFLKRGSGKLRRSTKVYTLEDEDCQHSNRTTGRIRSNKRCFPGYSWTVIVQREEAFAVQLVERILMAHKDKSDILSYSRDIFGRTHADIASAKCKLVLNRFRYLHERYDLKLGPPEHKSKLSLIKFAIDRTSSHIKPVALKFMNSRVHFLREVQSRSIGGFNSDFVIDLLKAYDGDSEDPDDVLFRQDAIFKGFSEYPYCVVMEVADHNLKKLIDQQSICGKEWEEIRSITRQLATALEHINSKGIVHGDIKPTNIVMTGKKLRIIDFDASASIDRNQNLGAQFSSAYVPPEMLFCSKNASGCSVVGVRSLQGPPEDVEDVNDDVISIYESHLEYSLLLAAPSFDMWSLGAILYLLCTGETLFKASVYDNTSESELRQLFDWSDKIKKEKLAILTNNKHARNLISLLLCKNPAKRLSSKYVLSHPFLTGKNPSRMQGDKAKFDVFISYRVNSDSDHVAMFYNFLTALGLSVWLDKECLLPGQLWEEGFCHGLINSSTFVCLLSRGAINHAGQSRQCFSKLTADSRCDNVLLEWNMALELRQRDMLDSIYPVFIGDKNFESTSCGDYFAAGCHPQYLPEIVVEAVSDKLQEHLDNQGLGAVYMEQATVKQIVDSICAYQGGFMKGNIRESISSIADQISDMIKMQKQNLMN